MTARTSAARLAVSYPVAGASDQPKPRKSGQITRYSPASRGITCRQVYQCCGKSCSSMTGSPVPASATWKRTPRACTKRWRTRAAGGNGRDREIVVCGTVLPLFRIR
jgi:hypothetical protein